MCFKSLAEMTTLQVYLYTGQNSSPQRGISLNSPQVRPSDEIKMHIEGNQRAELLALVLSFCPSSPYSTHPPPPHPPPQSHVLCSHPSEHSDYEI